jgi:pimeloyl-ACP methyl ester carboxylesterase
MKEIWLDTKPTKIYGKHAGPQNGPLVLGIHGWSQRNGWHTWEPLLEPMGEAGIHAVSIDMPGWGNSPQWPGLPLQPPGEVTRVITVVLDALGVDNAALMGKSWGGGVALATALAHPARISKLILSAPAFQEMSKLDKLQQPVLLAWAEDDPVIPYRMAAEFVRLIPNCQLETYASGGHSAAPKNAEDFAPKAAAFLQ